tara:strand:+ start:89 stop:799 length:711 start_codon:yes stop_codon:yes gene_type:complete
MSIKQINDLKIGAEMYDELYNRIIEEETVEDEFVEYEFDDFEDFLTEYGNSDNSLDLLSEGNNYYMDGVMNEWDNIIEILNDNDMLEYLEPKDMKKRKITDIFLYQVVVEVITDYVDENKEKIEEEKNKEKKRVNKYNDFKDEVDEDENNCSIGLIDGETLKIMVMGEYFNKYDISDEVCYEIRFYHAKEKATDLPIAFSDCYFKIEDLCDKIHYVEFNTLSAFAYELGNINFEED